MTKLILQVYQRKYTTVIRALRPCLCLCCCSKMTTFCLLFVCCHSVSELGR